MRVFFRIVVRSDGATDGDTWFEGEDKRQKAIDAAQAIARPGSLSAEDGDVVTVEEHHVHEIATFVKPTSS